MLKLALPKLQWWVPVQLFLVSGLVINLLTYRDRRVVLLLGATALAVTFVSHDFRGSPRDWSGRGMKQ